MRKRKKGVRNFVHVSINLLTNVEKNDRLIKNNKKNIKKLRKNDKKYKGVNMTDVLFTKKHKQINAFDGAHFLIQLYYKTGKKYRCTRSKLEKLLSIAGFVIMAKTEKALYKQDIVVNQCGTGFSEFPGFFPHDILEGSILENNKMIEDDLSSLKESMEEIPLSYKEVIDDKLSDDIAELLSDVFIQFGNYSSDTLGRAIDIFKEQISVESAFGKNIVDPICVQKYFCSPNAIKSDCNRNDLSKKNRIKMLYDSLLESTLETEITKAELKSTLAAIVDLQIKDETIVQNAFKSIIEYIKRNLKD